MAGIPCTSNVFLPGPNCSHRNAADDTWLRTLLNTPGQTPPNQITSRSQALASLRARLNAQDELEHWQLSPIHRIILGLDRGSVEDLLHFYPALLDTPDWQGQTPLHWACIRGDIHNTRLLLRHNAKVDRVDLTGRTALHYAACYAPVECVRALLEAGADCNATNSYGVAPLHFTVWTKDAKRENLRALFEHGANLEQKNGLGQTASYYALVAHSLEAVPDLIGFGANIETQGPFGKTPVQQCVQHRLPDMFKLFQTHGAKLNHVNFNGDSVLHIAAAHADIETMAVLTKAAIQGLDPVARNVSGMTPREIFENVRPNVYFGEDPGLEEVGRAFSALLASVRPDPDVVTGADANDAQGNALVQTLEHLSIQENAQDSDTFFDAVEEITP
jgi:ankyrin repeat protein